MTADPAAITKYPAENPPNCFEKIWRKRCMHGVGVRMSHSWSQFCIQLRKQNIRNPGKVCILDFFRNCCVAQTSLFLYSLSRSQNWKVGPALYLALFEKAWPGSTEPLSHPTSLTILRHWLPTFSQVLRAYLDAYNKQKFEMSLYTWSQSQNRSL